MIRVLLFVGLLLWNGLALAGNVWDNLWRTPDQQAEQLMRQGKAAEAAHIYSDPRCRAYAELRAGHYAQAAHDFAAFHDSDGHYNRGNALARSGDLQGAIRAYDAALASNPGNRDALHNRDLVAKALKKQPPQTPPPSGKSSPSNTGKPQSSKDKDVGKQGKPKHGDQKDANSKPSNKDQQGQAKPGNEGESGQENQPGKQQNGQPKPDDTAQARRDAAASLGQPAPDTKPGPSEHPATEQQLAREQWLRRIPDDPGGLLRRKFMIEHMIRQQRGQP
jgi:Ca-activated chloride channel family protein